MSWTIHPRTVAKERRQARLLETLQAQPEGRATVPALRAALGMKDWTFSDDITDLVNAGHVQRSRVTLKGQRRGTDYVQATWLPCAECAGYGEIDMVFAHGIQAQDCGACEGTGRAA